jgi:hypothetical protein
LRDREIDDLGWVFGPDGAESADRVAIVELDLDRPSVGEMSAGESSTGYNGRQRAAGAEA